MQLCYNLGAWRALLHGSHAPILLPLRVSVSELERSRSAVPSYTPPSRTEFEDDDFEPGASTNDGSRIREGLPPGFRMRHDAHYVEQLTSRAGASQIRLIPLRDIEGVRPPDARDLTPLVRSMSRHGMLQPLLVRPRGGRFELIAGARRLAAAAIAGLAEAPCIVHVVDDLQARALAEALMREEPSVPLADGVASDVPVSGLTELTRAFGSIASCLHLLGERDAVLRDRVALDLVRAEVHRAQRLVACLRLLGSEPTLSLEVLPLRRAIDQVIDTLAAECRLCGATVSSTSDDPSLAVRADPNILATGLASAIGGMLAIAQQNRQPALDVRANASASRTSVLLEVVQHAASVPSRDLERFFDPDWTDRPGGYQAAVELAAARRAIELTHGGVEVLPAERGGARLVLLLPLA